MLIWKLEKIGKFNILPTVPISFTVREREREDLSGLKNKEFTMTA
jgi:hypothetical protein